MTKLSKFLRLLPLFAVAVFAFATATSQPAEARHGGRHHHGMSMHHGHHHHMMRHHHWRRGDCSIVRKRFVDRRGMPMWRAVRVCSRWM